MEIYDNQVQLLALLSRLRVIEFHILERIYENGRIIIIISIIRNGD